MAVALILCATGDAFVAAASAPTAPAPAIAPDPPTRLWVVREAPSVRGPGVVRAQRIDVDWTAVADAGDGDRVVLELFDGRSLMGRIERRRVMAPRRVALSGRLDTVAPGAFALSVRGTGLAGIVRTGSAGTYRIRGSADGSLNLEAIDEAAIPWCGLEGAPRFDAGAVRPPDQAGRAGGLCDDGSVLDLLVVYTREARDAAGGTDNLLAEIDLMVENMNISLDNGVVYTQMNLVYARELATSQNLINLGNLAGRDDGIVDGVHLLRDAYGADEVALVHSGGGGVAWGLRNLDPESEALAFCMNGRDSMPFIIAHEVGHNLGCCHARGDGGGCEPEGGLLFPFSNGYRFVGESQTEWRTVMVYPPGIWSAIYSNPNVEFDGVPTGIPRGQDSADNARTINLAASTIATWRRNDPICEELDLPSDALLLLAVNG